MEIELLKLLQSVGLSSLETNSYIPIACISRRRPTNSLNSVCTTFINSEEKL